MISAPDYTIAVRRVVNGDSVTFEARVKELPDVIEFADTSDGAYALAIETIETTSAMFDEMGRSMPSPCEPPEIEYSGRVTLRMPRSLHRVLAECALEEDSSFNQYLVGMLSYVSGAKHGRQNASQQWIPIEGNSTVAIQSTGNRRVIASYDDVEKRPRSAVWGLIPASV